MKALLQVVKNAKVTSNGEKLGSINRGLSVFLGVSKDDETKNAKKLAEKIIQLRIFPDEEGKMNLSVQSVDGEILVISQFTLYGKIKSGRRPSFSHAASYDKAKKLYKHFVSLLRDNTSLTVETGRFGDYMEIELTNDGPVTFMLES